MVRSGDLALYYPRDMAIWFPEAYRFIGRDNDEKFHRMIVAVPKFPEYPSTYDRRTPCDVAFFFGDDTERWLKALVDAGRSSIEELARHQHTRVSRDAYEQGKAELAARFRLRFTFQAKRGGEDDLITHEFAAVPQCYFMSPVTVGSREILTLVLRCSTWMAP
jgi:hypothetical protein